MPTAFPLSPTRRRRSSANHGQVLIAVALFVAVLIAEAAVVVLAAGNIDIAALYITTT